MSAQAAIVPDAGPVRVLVVWWPDWPVAAAVAAEGLDGDSPIALLDHGLVHACSPAARATGVRRGLKQREAQARCPDLTVLLHDEARDQRMFEPVLRTLEDGVPLVQVLRPGMVVIRAQGVVRYHGGEREAADAVRMLAQSPAEQGRSAQTADVRVGIADGPFAAEQAARTAPSGGTAIVPPGAAAAFLAPLPVSLLGVPSLAGLLAKLGIRTIGGFAELDAASVRDRFGEEGLAVHRVAAGLDPSAFVPRIVPAERATLLAFEPPLERVDQIAFALRQTAERFLDALAADLLVCTGLEVTVEQERGAPSVRTWLHPRSFTPLDVIDRVRWQIEGADLSTPVVQVRLEPAMVDAAAAHEQGLWGSGPDERIHHALTRVQSLLGHEAVVTPVIGGGRMSADRRVLVPWGERALSDRATDRPWPGRLPGFAPASVFPATTPVVLLDQAGEPLDVTERGRLTGIPTALVADGTPPAAISAWAGPWPLEERWWDAAAARSVHRMQVVADGSAWLVYLEQGRWWTEARYT